MRRAAFLLASLFLIAEARAADLMIEAREWPASAGSYRGSGSVRGVLRVTNNGPEPVDDAVVTIAADPLSTPVTIATARTTCTNGVCRLPALAAGEHVDMNLFIRTPFLSGRVTITAEVTSSTADPAPRNNSVSGGRLRRARTRSRSRALGRLARSSAAAVLSADLDSAG